MKQLKAYWNKGLRWMLSSLLTLLGFSSCEWTDPGEDPIICMYGTPTSYYEIKGKVTNQAGEPLAGIQVNVPRIYFGTVDIPGRILTNPRGYETVIDTIYQSSDTLLTTTSGNSYIELAPYLTDKEGRFKMTCSHFPQDTLRYELIFTDIDSLAPQMATDTVQVTFAGREFKDGDGAWYIGKTEKEITVVLNPQKEENE